MSKSRFVYVLAIVTIIFILYTVVKRFGSDAIEHGSDVVSLESSPVVPASESIKRMKVEEGFEVELIASEPLVQTPVAMIFDEQARLWVVEMGGYMNDTLGAGEQDRNGRIVILEDTDSDGVMDNRKIFLDSLMMPRAICLVEDGVLVAESNQLWYYKIMGDKPGVGTMVDSAYAQPANAQKESNGLLRAMDNWIYNANSDKRYRKKGDNWLIERTHFRGQWGITQDDYGRLYYNNNSVNLIGDFFSPGLGAGNIDQAEVAGFNENIVADTRVYPIRPTPGVNRGYLKGILDDSLRLVNFTAACSPQFYRGGLFGKEYESNVFVAEPAANLVKRDIMNFQDFQVKGKPAYVHREFLASTDERFRPVGLYNGPDGSLYVVDMYRGILEHKSFMTDYLKQEIAKRMLTGPLALGRIYRIFPAGKKRERMDFYSESSKWVDLLNSDNGWVRDKCQQLIIDNKVIRSVPTLKSNLKQVNKPILVTHSLWTLEGLGALTLEDVKPFLKHPSWILRSQALSVLPSLANKNSGNEIHGLLEGMLNNSDSLDAAYIALVAKSIETFDKKKTSALLASIVKKYPGNRFVVDAVLSNLHNNEDEFERKLHVLAADTNLIIHQRLRKLKANIFRNRLKGNAAMLEKTFPEGARIYRSTCSACHGLDGNGLKSVAPPLNQSQWVVGSKKKLLYIVLAGLTGPIKVNGYLYQPPEINGDMPGIGQNKEISDVQLAQLLSFIRLSWQNNADQVTKDDVAEARIFLKDRKQFFSAWELENLQ